MTGTPCTHALLLDTPRRCLRARMGHAPANISSDIPIEGRTQGPLAPWGSQSFGVRLMEPQLCQPSGTTTWRDSTRLAAEGWTGAPATLPHTQGWEKVAAEKIPKQLQVVRIQPHSLRNCVLLPRGSPGPPVPNNAHPHTSRRGSRDQGGLGTPEDTKGCFDPARKTQKWWPAEKQGPTHGYGEWRQTHS